MGLHSKNMGKWWGCSGMAYGAWVRCHSPVFPRPTITDPSPPLYSHPPRPELPGGSRLLILCPPWAPLPAGGHGLCRAGSTGSLLCGRLKPAACTCLSSAYNVETEYNLVHYVGLQQATFFPVPANPLSPSLPSCRFSPVHPSVDQGTCKTLPHLTLAVDITPEALAS